MKFKNSLQETKRDGIDSRLNLLCFCSYTVLKSLGCLFMRRNVYSIQEQGGLILAPTGWTLCSTREIVVATHPFLVQFYGVSKEWERIQQKRNYVVCELKRDKDTSLPGYLYGWTVKESVSGQRYKSQSHSTSLLLNFDPRLYTFYLWTFLISQLYTLLSY